MIDLTMVGKSLRSCRLLAITSDADDDRTTEAGNGCASFCRGRLPNPIARTLALVHARPCNKAGVDCEVSLGSMQSRIKVDLLNSGRRLPVENAALADDGILK